MLSTSKLIRLCELNMQRDTGSHPTVNQTIGLSESMLSAQIGSRNPRSQAKTFYITVTRSFIPKMLGVEPGTFCMQSRCSSREPWPLPKWCLSGR